MSKEEFIQNYRENFMKEDSMIKDMFSKASTDKEKAILNKTLDYSLGLAYEKYAKEYFESKGVGSYVSTMLRLTGAVADFVGTYMFWALGGAGFGFKGIGLLEKSVADAIDEAHYIKHAQHDSLEDSLKDNAKIVSEGMVERAAAYLPLGVGEVADLLRGRSKYDAKVTEDALKHAKDKFYDYVRRPDDLKIAGLKNFERSDEMSLNTAA